MKYAILVLICAATMLGCADRGGVAVFDGRTTMHMPFEAGTKWLCTQGTEASYSHNGNSTRYDLDFDTPNPPNEPAMLYAPLAGTAYVHDDGTGFGKHVNIDLNDGTYIVLGHMKHVYVGNAMFVQVGEAVGLAGSTGSSSGEHVHVGLHAGDADQFAGRGTSIPSNMFDRDVNANPSITRPNSGAEHICGIPGGHKYESQLPLFMLGPELPDEAGGGGDDDDDSVGNGLAELCWTTQGLTGTRNGELWVQEGSWETVTSSSGSFTQLCGTIAGGSGTSIIVNGEYEANNTPGSPWWICAHTGSDTSHVYGSFWINGIQRTPTVQDWGGGCDVRLTIP
ncbi:MAG TPA: M23 family metallopeptidase [Patescibacteria group bacterium]|nr:M23 family metallopeptidase [Patescibacteria group bacterium]